VYPNVMKLDITSVSASWNAVFGASARANPLGDMYRASFRRKIPRTGFWLGALTAFVTHSIPMLVLSVPRGVIGGMTAYLWILVTLAPVIAVHVLVAALFGLALSLALLVTGTLLMPVLIRMLQTTGARAALMTLLGLLGFAAVTMFYAQLVGQNPLIATNGGVFGWLSAIAPALGGAALGVTVARRTAAYLVNRAAG
jgi:hypothetical protein